MLKKKKIIIGILIIISCIFIFLRDNIIEKCSDHLYLKSELRIYPTYQKNSYRIYGRNIPEPINNFDLIVEEIKVYMSKDRDGIITYSISDPNSFGYSDKKINSFFEFLNQDYKKKKKISSKYYDYSRECQYENDYNPITFKKTWTNATNFDELEKIVRKNKKKYKEYLANAKKEANTKNNLVSEENFKILENIRKNLNEKNKFLDELKKEMKKKKGKL